MVPVPEPVVVPKVVPEPRVDEEPRVPTVVVAKPPPLLPVLVPLVEVAEPAWQRMDKKVSC